MKKIIITLLVLIILLIVFTFKIIFETTTTTTINNFEDFSKNKKYPANVKKVVDGDTLWIEVDDYSFKARLLSIDAPEYTEKIEEYGKEATQYVRRLINNASKIEIEFDSGEYSDKYNHGLIYLWVDDELLNSSILSQGLAEIKYVKKGGDKYLKQMKQAENKAKIKKLNIWK